MQLNPIVCSEFPDEVSGDVIREYTSSSKNQHKRKPSPPKVTFEKYERVLYEVCLEYCSPDLPDDDETYEYGYAPLSSKGKEVLAHVMEALGIEEGDPEYFAQSPLGYYDIP